MSANVSLSSSFIFGILCNLLVQTRDKLLHFLLKSFVKEYFVDTFSIEITFALVRSVDLIYLYVYMFMCCSTCSVCSLKISKQNYILRVPTNYPYLHFVG